MRKSQIQWKFTGVRERLLSESAMSGEACEALNVRPVAGALAVTGVPATVGQIAPDERLILSDAEGRRLTLCGDEVRYDGVAVTTLSGTFVAAYNVGSRLAVVVTDAGVTTLLRTSAGYEPLSVDDALPQLSLTASSGAALTATVDAVTFAEGYSEWGGSLDQTDAGKVLSALRRSWQQLTTQGVAAGAHTAPLLARYGVRLYDDTYLYLSDPVLLGTSTLANALPLRADVTVASGKYAGTASATLTMQTYTLGVEVGRGVAAAWHPLVKAVDVLVTDEVAVVATTEALTYRCLTASGSERRAMLEFGFAARSQSEVAALLSLERWRVAATCSDLTALDALTWTADAEPYARSFSAAEAAEMSRRQRVTDRPTSAMVLAGRLHYTTSDGSVVVCAAGNPFVAEQRRATGGTGLRGICAAPRTLYASGFGRYPAFVFADEGIFAMPLAGSSALYGEPRLGSRAVLAPGTTAVEGGDSVYFADAAGRFCRLLGNDVSVLLRHTAVTAMAYDGVHAELYALTSDGRLLAFGADDTYSERTLSAADVSAPTVTQLYANATQSLAVTSDGTVVDLTSEQSVGARLFTYRSQWVSAGVSGGLAPWRLGRPLAVAWDVYGRDVEATLTLRGALGSGTVADASATTLTAVSLRGNPATPTVARVASAPWRVLQVELTGRAAAGTLLRADIAR